MNISEFFIRRAITTTLVMAGVTVFGVLAYMGLPVSDLPNVDFPTLSVSATLPGANPETMANTVATPLEREFSSIAGISSINSVNTLGRTQVTLQFDLSRDLDAAAQDVQAAISSASRFLPNNLPQPPTYRKVNPADQPILYIGLSSATLPLYRVDEFAETNLAQRMSMVNGVAQVQVYGAQKYAVRIQVDPDALASRGIGIDEVRTALSEGNSNLPSGVLQGPNKAYTVETTGQLSTAGEFRPLIVAYRNGNPVRLEQIARVTDSVEDSRTASWFNGQRSVLLAIQRQPGTNTVEIVDAIRKMLPALQSQIPSGVSLEILFDRSIPIRESIRDVKFTLLLTIGLVVLVIFAFLRNASATIIPSLAVPLSIVATFAAMDLLGYTLDNLSAMALTLSVGFVVDDAIVVLENIVRHREMGKDRMQAAIDGAREIGFTIVSMTLSLVAVFIPVLFMGGIVGRLLREFAVVISVAILVSGVISLVLTPMLCSRFLNYEKDEKHGKAYQWSERMFERALHLYDRTLQRVLDHRLITVIVTLVLVAITGYLFVRIPKGFFPPEDTGLLFGSTEAAQDISFDDMVRHQKRVAEVVAHNPYVAAYQSTVGGSGPGGGTNTGRIFMRLKDGKRPDAEEIIQGMRREFARIPGISVFLQVPPSIRIGGAISKSLYQFTLQDTDTKQLYKLTPQVEARLKQMPDLQDVTSDLRLSSPQVTVEIDRDKARALGLSATNIENSLYDAFGQRQISQIYTSSNQYYVIMELLPEFQRDPNALSRLYLRSGSQGGTGEPASASPGGVRNNGLGTQTSTTGGLIPLSTVTKLKPGVAPIQVSHYGQLPAVTISFNLRPGVSLGDAVDKINEAVQQMGLPSTVTTVFQGTAQAFQESFRNLWVLLLIAVLVIYLVLGILYESFVHPLTILSGLPSAGLGALLTLMLFGIDLNIYAFVGLILLIGIVKKNAIMMIDFAIEAQRHGKPAREAIHEGSLLRFRPIMMTTMAALLGTMPIALGFGAGAESRRPLGLAVVGGLMVSQLITLYLTPVVYLYLEEFQEKVDAWRERRKGKKGEGKKDEGKKDEGKPEDQKPAPKVELEKKPEPQPEPEPEPVR